MKRIWRHECITEDGRLFRSFETIEAIEEFISWNIEDRGLDWRAGYDIRFADGFQLKFRKKNGDEIKTYK